MLVYTGGRLEPGALSDSVTVTVTGTGTAFVTGVENAVVREGRDEVVRWVDHMDSKVVVTRPYVVDLHVDILSIGAVAVDVDFAVDVVEVVKSETSYPVAHRALEPEPDPQSTSWHSDKFRPRTRILPDSVGILGGTLGCPHHTHIHGTVPSRMPKLVMQLSSMPAAAAAEVVGIEMVPGLHRRFDLEGNTTRFED